LECISFIKSNFKLNNISIALYPSFSKSINPHYKTINKIRDEMEFVSSEKSELESMVKIMNILKEKKINILLIHEVNNSLFI